MMFDEFDTDKDGRISKGQFREVLVGLGLGDHLSGEDIDTLVNVADKNGDDWINLQEFTEWLYSSGGLGTMAAPSEVGSEKGESEERRVEKNLRKQLCETREELEKLKLLQKKAEADAAGLEEALEKRWGLKLQRQLREAEEAFERDSEANFEFWRSICNASAAPTLGSSLDMSSVELLGSGKYAFVLKSKRVNDGPSVVVKLMSTRWAHVASKEWQQAQAIGHHPNIVPYEDALLHKDTDKCVLELLQKGQDAGKLQGRNKRANFPDKYICLIEEFMNRGTVQDWIDKDMLLPGGVLVVMQKTACALAYMHSKGITHNDIKPENVLLHQENIKDSRSEVIVKLADLGLAQYSKDRSADFMQYGLTVHSMMTGERFGSRKFKLELAKAWIGEVSLLTGGLGGAIEAGISTAMSKVPDMLKQVWDQEITMLELSTHKRLQGWTFFDGETSEHDMPAVLEEKEEAAAVDEEVGELKEMPGPAVPMKASKSLRRMNSKIDDDTLRNIGQMSARFHSELADPVESHSDESDWH